MLVFSNLVYKFNVLQTILLDFFRSKMNFKYIWNGDMKVIKDDSNKHEKKPILSTLTHNIINSNSN